MTGVVLVTGGTSGLGRALVRRYCADGRTVVFTSRSGTRVRDALEGLPPGGAPVVGVVCASGDVHATARLFDEHRPAVVVNNAAVSGGHGAFIDCDDADDADVFETNVVGAMVTTRLALRAGAHVFNIVGAGADGSPTPMYTAYGASKAALMQLSRSLQAEGHGRVHTVSPGMMMTPLLLDGAPRFLAECVFPIVCEDPDVVADVVANAIDDVVRRDRRAQHVRCFSPANAVARLLGLKPRVRAPLHVADPPL